MDVQHEIKSLNSRLDSVNEFVGGLESRLDQLGTGFAALAVLANNLRDCVESQVEMFKGAAARR